MPIQLNKLLFTVIAILLLVGVATVVSIILTFKDSDEIKDDFKKERMLHAVDEVSLKISSDLRTCEKTTWELSSMVGNETGNKTFHAQMISTSLLRASDVFVGLGASSIVVWSTQTRITKQLKIVNSGSYSQHYDLLEYVIPPLSIGTSSAYIALDRWSSYCMLAQDKQKDISVSVILGNSNLESSLKLASTGNTSVTDLTSVLSDNEIETFSKFQRLDSIKTFAGDGNRIHSFLTIDSASSRFFILSTTTNSSNDSVNSWLLAVIFSIVYLIVVSFVGYCLWSNLKAPSDRIITAILSMGALNFEEVDTILSKTDVGSSQLCNVLRAIVVASDSLKNFKAYLPKSLFNVEDLFSENDDDEMPPHLNHSPYHVPHIRAVSVLSSSRFSEISIPHNPTENFLHPSSWAVCLMIRFEEVERQMISEVRTINEWQNQYSDLITIMEHAGSTHGGGILVHPFTATPGTMMLTWDLLSTGRLSRSQIIQKASHAAMYLRSVLNITGISVVADNCKTGHIGSSTTKTYVVLGSIIPRLYSINAYAQYIAKMIARSVVLTDNGTAAEINKSHGHRIDDLHAPMIGMMKDAQAIVPASFSSEGGKQRQCLVICEIRTEEDLHRSDENIDTVNKAVEPPGDNTWMYEMATSMRTIVSDTDDLAEKIMRSQLRYFPFDDIISNILNGDRLIRDEDLKRSSSHYSKSNPVDKVVIDALEFTKTTPEDFIVSYVSTSIVSQWNRIPDYMLRATVPSSLISPEWHKQRSMAVITP